MKQLTVRVVDSKLHHELKAAAKRRGLSVNRTILLVLRGALDSGAVDQRAATQHHDLDHLAGAWSQSDGEDRERQLAKPEASTRTWGAEQFDAGYVGLLGIQARTSGGCRRHPPSAVYSAVEYRAG